MTGYRPNAYDRQRIGDAQVIGAKCPDWLVIYGAYSRLFRAYPAKDGFAVADKTVYDPAAAARHWNALRDLYGAQL
jgi:hypothetical protein